MLPPIGNSVTAVAGSLSLTPCARVWIRSSSGAGSSRNTSMLGVGAAAGGVSILLEDGHHPNNRHHCCVFGTSVYDSLGKYSSLSNQSSYQARISHHEALHYDRRMVFVSEEEGPQKIESSADDNMEEDEHDIFYNYRIVLASSPTDQTTMSSDTVEWSQQPIPLGRAKHFPPLGATACPTTVKPTTDGDILQKKKPFTQLAAVGLVLDSPKGEYVLLTRRPSHMRSFPGAWVLPGGGFDPIAGDTSLQDTVAREIQEETGLSLLGTRLQQQQQQQRKRQQRFGDEGGIRPFCLWESCYPTDPHSPGPIRAHHIVVFYQAVCDWQQQGTRNDDITSTIAVHGSRPALHLQKAEVDSALWLSVEDFRQILAHMHASQESPSSESRSTDKSSSEYLSQPSSLDKSIPIYKADGSVVQGSLNTLVGIYPQHERETAEGTTEKELCGIAQGSLFALEELLLNSQHSQSAATVSPGGDESDGSKGLNWIRSDFSN